jgi:hypothetical protein
MHYSIIAATSDIVAAMSLAQEAQPASKRNSGAQGIICLGELIYKMSFVLYMCEFVDAVNVR